MIVPTNNIKTGSRLRPAVFKPLNTDMKMHELLREQQLDEAAPLAFLMPYLPQGLAWIASASAMTIVTWVLAGWGGYSVGEYIKDTVAKEGPDPRRWSAETKSQLAKDIIVEAIFAALPIAVSTKIGRGAIASVIALWPNAVTQQAFEKMLPRIEDTMARP
jgi:hypothetical protein